MHNTDSHPPQPPQPTRSCRRYGPRIALLRTDALSSRATLRVTAHIAGCSWCQHELALYDAVDQAARRRLAGVPFVPARLEDIVQAAESLPTAGPSREEPSRGVDRRHSFRQSTLTAASSLAAVLAVTLLAAVLFTTRGVSDRSVSPLATEPAPLPRAQTQVGGLEATLQVVIGGPYFLRELLPVDVSLTNHTQQMVQLLEPPTTADLCHDSALMARLTAGSDPSVAFPPIPIGFGCDSVLHTTRVQPGETLIIHQYVPLTRSGAVTLSMQSARLCTPDTPPCRSATPVPFDPLDGHWPSMQLQVQAQVPQGRTLSLHEQPGRVLIETPAGAQGRLLAMQSVACEAAQQLGPALVVNGARWTPLATNVLEEATCPSAHPTWVYIVSAPGYAIVFGSQHA